MDWLEDVKRKKEESLREEKESAENEKADVMRNFNELSPMVERLLEDLGQASFKPDKSLFGLIEKKSYHIEKFPPNSWVIKNSYGESYSYYRVSLYHPGVTTGIPYKRVVEQLSITSRYFFLVTAGKKTEWIATKDTSELQLKEALKVAYQLGLAHYDAPLYP